MEVNSYRIDKIPKCGAMDSKYFGRPNAFEEDVKRHREEYEQRCNTANRILENFITQTTNQSENLSIIVQECVKLKEKYKI